MSVLCAHFLCYLEQNLKYINELDVNYIVEFDRKNANDAVFYSCANYDFEKFVTTTTGYKFAYGSCSDISVIAPKAKIAAVNLSCGYYNPHTPHEYVVFDEMVNTIEAAKKLIIEKSNKFEYIEKKYTPVTTAYSKGSVSKFQKPRFLNDRAYDFHHQDDYSQMSFDEFMGKSKKYTTEPDDFDPDLGLCLEVYYIDVDGEEHIETEYGNTKSEAWAKFFLNNPDASFNMIVDYSFC